MFKTDIIKTYIFEPNYYECEKKNIYDILKIFNNKLYSYIKIYKSCLIKTKQIKQNYIIFSYFYYYNNKFFYTNLKIKKYDNTEIDIKNCYDTDIYNFDLKITNLCIITKIDKDIYINKDIYIKYINNTAIRKHKFYNSKYYYYKYYITYYINYYIIIYNDIKKNYINKLRNCNTILCNFSRNFMLFI